MRHESAASGHAHEGSVTPPRMTAQSHPPESAAEAAGRTSLGHRFQRALAGGPNRRFLGFHPSPGGAASLSPFLNRRLALPILALLALLAASLLFLLPGGPLHAQEAAILYPENDTGVVATLTAVDPEGESIVWSLDETVGDDEDFDIENGVLTFKSSPDFESPQGGNADNSNTYVVTVQASDGGDDTTAKEVLTIEVTNVEEPGTVTLSTLQPQVGVAITATLTDPDDATATTVTWQWYRGNSEIVGATDGADTLMSSYTPTTGDVGSVLRATAMYDDGEDDDKTAQEDSAHAVRQAPESNIPPTFPDQDLAQENVQTEQTREVAENTPSGTNIGAPVVASDPDVLTYSLSGTNAAAFDINRATGQLITKVALNFEGTPTYTVTVTATDPFKATVTSVVTITLTDVNEDPTVMGAASIDHKEDGTVLDVDASNDIPNAAEYTATDEDDADNAATGLTWLLSGADASKFNITMTGDMRILSFVNNPDFESPGDSGRNNVYEVTVKVTDSEGNSDEQDVTVKVTNVEEPGTVTLSTLQPRVGFPVTATLTDPDNVTEGSVSWQWYDGAIDENDLEANAIEDATSDTYTPTTDDVDDTLTARASYTDGNANESDDKDVMTGAAANEVLVDTRNQAPEFPDQDDEMEGRQTAQTREVIENTVAGENIGDRVEATDEDANLTYSLGGTDAASFDIDRGEAPATAGQLKTKAALDKEMKDTYTVTVTAADSLGLSSTITVTIKVTNMDEMPDLEGEAPEEYAENGTGDVARFTAEDPEGESIIWSLTASGDSEDFSIENGVLRFESAPDFENPADTGTNNMYEVTVRASDGGVGTTATEEVTIEVTNVEEPGTVTLSTLQPQVDVAITATLTDPDNATANTITWQWYRGSSPIVDENNGAGTDMSSYTPAVGDVGGILRATAMYDDGEGEDKTAREDSYRSVRSASATNINPVFSDQDLSMTGVQTAQTREVAENTRAGTNLGAPVSARDPGDLLTYSLSGTNAAAFDINRATGQLTTKAALDFEDTNNPDDDEFEVTVTATDPVGATAMSQVTITLTDVNEDPTVMGAASIDHKENGTVLDVDASNDIPNAAEYTATDEDDADDAATGLTWLLSGADASKFNITMTGDMRILSFVNNPDFESPGDSGRNNVYEVTVKVTDSEGNSDEQDVTVKVTNVEEPGTVTLSTLQPRVGFPVTATLSDSDNVTAGSVSWQWYRGSVQITNLPEECAETTSDNCAIKDAASDTYTPVADDIRDTLTAVASYTDGSPNADDAKDVVAARAANEVLADTRNKAPVFPDQDGEMEGRQTAQTRVVAENTVVGEDIGGPVEATDFITTNNGETTPEILTYSLGGADVASFDINRSSGQLQTKAELDKETKDTYTVTVTATDPSGETATAMVTIKVTNMDEPPMIMLGGLAISGMGRVDYAEDRRDDVATYRASGPDAASATWTLEGDDAGDFDISSSGVLTFMSSPDHETPADADTDNVYMVTVKANDGTYSDTHDVTITVTNVDEAPVITGDAALDYAENGTGPVATYSATDPESATITWSLEGDDAADFEISAGGVLTFKSSPDYQAAADADTDNAYEVTVVASDGTNEDRLDVTITVTDVNEAPPVITGDAPPDYAENGTGPVAAYSATDPEGATITWSLGGDDAADFEISAGGVLTFKSSPDHETPADADTDNAYEVTVLASDGTYFDTHDVTVTVTNVDEAPVITGDAAPDYAENGTGPVATYEATDPEGATIITWSLEGDDAADFDISTAGVLTFKQSPDYEMPADADTGNAYEVMVVASDGTNEDRLDVTITVTDVDEDVVPADPLVDKYDANDNGEIERAEVFAAINDYLDGGADAPTRADVFKLINLYLGD